MTVIIRHTPTEGNCAVPIATCNTLLFTIGLSHQCPVSYDSATHTCATPTVICIAHQWRIPPQPLLAWEFYSV